MFHAKRKIEKERKKLGGEVQINYNIQNEGSKIQFHPTCGVPITRCVLTLID